MTFPACVADGGEAGEHGGAPGRVPEAWGSSKWRQSPVALESRVRLEKRKKEEIGWPGFFGAAAGEAL